MTIFAHHASSAMKHAYLGSQNALMLHTSVYHIAVSLLTTCVHITTKRHISTYRNCDLSLSDEISKYGDFDMSKSDAWTKSAAISQYSTPSSYHGFLSFRYSDIWWLKAIAQCRYSTDCFRLKVFYLILKFFKLNGIHQYDMYSCQIQ